MKKRCETDLVREILQYLELRKKTGVGGAWRQNNGAATGESNGKRRFIRFTSMPGIADVIGILKPSGRMLAIEAKMPGNKPTEDQQNFLDLIDGSGGVAFVAWSLDDVISRLRKEGL